MLSIHSSYLLVFLPLFYIFFYLISFRFHYQHLYPIIRVPSARLPQYVVSVSIIPVGSGSSQFINIIYQYNLSIYFSINFLPYFFFFFTRKNFNLIYFSNIFQLFFLYSFYSIIYTFSTYLLILSRKSGLYIVYLI